MGQGVVCWKCGASLRKLGLPLGRFDLCPECRNDLHVCRLCRSYHSNVSGKCSKEEAGYVADKEQANYCQYFKARPNAYEAINAESEVQLNSELASLFGDDGEPSDSQEPLKSNKEKARSSLNTLFGEDVALDSLSEEEKAQKELEALFKK
ncbi:hypothetical protein ACFL2V_14640 [Pseudomonadota bacterium]